MMNSVSRYFAIISFCLVMSGCASRGVIKSVDTEGIQSIRKVAVASQLGTTFTGSLTATTVFGNSNYKTDVSEWHVDRTAVEVIIEAIQQGGQRSTMALPSKNAKLPELLQAARVGGADTLLLVQQTGYSNQPDFRPGYGFYRRTLFGMDKSCIYSLFVTGAYDVKSGREIGLAWSFPRGGSIPCNSTSGLAWKDDFMKYTPQEKELIRKAVITSVTNNVRTSLKALGL